jgi:uncharacterized surface protein with fasciclin (FAS1) repeats
MNHVPHRTRAASWRHGLTRLVAALALALVGSGGALAVSTIVPSEFTTTSGTMWQFIVDHSAHTLNPTCYQSSAQRNESYNCLKVALLATGIDKSLRGGGPVTLFAPTDAGFAELAKLMGSTPFRVLMTQPAKLTELLHSVMVEGRYTSADLQARSVRATGRLTLPTLAGTELELTFGRFTTGHGRVKVRVGPTTAQPAWEPYLVGHSVALDNGVVIPVDMVYLPSTLR